MEWIPVEQMYKDTGAEMAQGPLGWREQDIQGHTLKTPHEDPLTGIIWRLPEDL